MTSTSLLKRLYKDYSKEFLKKIFLSGFFAILVAGSTSAIAWLLAPAIKKIFLEKDQTLIIIIMDGFAILKVALNLVNE